MTDKKNNPYNLSLGLNIAVGMLVFILGGVKLSQKTKNETWTLVGILLGFAYSSYEIWKAVKKSNES